MLSTKKTLASNTQTIEETSIIQPKLHKSHYKILRFAADTTYHYAQKKQSAYIPTYITASPTTKIADMSPEELKNYLTKLEAKQSLIAKLIFPQDF